MPPAAWVSGKPHPRRLCFPDPAPRADHYGNQDRAPLKPICTAPGRGCSHRLCHALPAGPSQNSIGLRDSSGMGNAFESHWKEKWERPLEGPWQKRVMRRAKERQAPSTPTTPGFSPQRALLTGCPYSALLLVLLLSLLSAQLQSLTAGAKVACKSVTASPQMWPRNPLNS